jgi:hypothetical protein
VKDLKAVSLCLMVLTLLMPLQAHGENRMQIGMRPANIALLIATVDRVEFADGLRICICFGASSPF